MPLYSRERMVQSSVQCVMVIKMTAFDKSWGVVKNENSCSKCGNFIHFQDEPYWSIGECRKCHGIVKAEEDWINMTGEKYLAYRKKAIQDHFDATGAEEMCCDEMEEEVVDSGGTPDWEFCPWCGEYVTPPR